MIKIRERIKKLAKVYLDYLKRDEYEQFCDEVEQIVKELRFYPPKEGLERPKSVNNAKRFDFIGEVQEVSYQGPFKIPYWASGLVADTMIVILRRRIEGNDFDVFAKELYDICKQSKDEDKNFKKNGLIRLITEESEVE